MGQNSKIEWTHHTLNPWRGCTKATWTDAAGKTHLHPGCLNCYAEVDYSVKMHGIKWGKGQERKPKSDSGWAEPMRWARAAAKAGDRHRVFCASLADVLDPEVPDSMRERIWPVIEDTAWVCGGCGRPCSHSSDTAHRTARLLDLDSVGAACEGKNGRCFTTPMGGLDFLLLTKRPEEWRRIPAWVRPLAWLGTSVSDQQTADEWVPRLLEADGFRLLFLSIEPLVGPVNLWASWLSVPSDEHSRAQHVGRSISWAICGGESGPRARPCHVAWIRSIVRQCREAGVAAFVKQLGSRPRMNYYEWNRWAYEHGYVDGPQVFVDGKPWDTTRFQPPTYTEVDLPLEDSTGRNPEEWPEDLRVREFPPF